MYVPSFIESVLGLVLVAVVSGFVSRRGSAPAFAGWIPWGAGAIVIVAVAVGTASVVMGPEGAHLAQPAKLGAAGGVVGGALALGIASLMTVLSRNG